MKIPTQYLLLISNVQLDLAINMKAALLASFFMLLLQVEPFICIPTICPWGNQEFDQVDPGGAESYDYEYKYSEEIKEVANVSDGDRLVGGRVTNTRSKFQREESSAQEISILGRLELEWNGELHGMQW